MNVSAFQQDSADEGAPDPHRGLPGGAQVHAGGGHRPGRDAVPHRQPDLREQDQGLPLARAPKARHQQTERLPTARQRHLIASFFSQ